MDAWCTLGGGIASHGYSGDDDGFAMGGLPLFSAQPACGAAGNKSQQLVSDSATHNHECTRIVQMRHDGMKKLMFRECGCPRRHRSWIEATRRLCPGVAGRLVEQHSLAITIFGAALGRDAPPKQKWEPPS